MILTEPLKLVRLSLQEFLLLKVVWYFNLVDYHTVVVDLSKAIGLLKVRPTDFIIVRDVIAFAKAGDSQVDVGYPCVHVHKHDVVVEQKNVK